MPHLVGINNVKVGKCTHCLSIYWIFRFSSIRYSQNSPKKHINTIDIKAQPLAIFVNNECPLAWVICPVCNYLCQWWLWSQNLLLCHETWTFRGNTPPLRWAKQRLFRGFMIILLIDILLSYDDGHMTWLTFLYEKQSSGLLFSTSQLFCYFRSTWRVMLYKFPVNLKPECRQETSTWQIGYS